MDPAIGATDGVCPHLVSQPSSTLDRNGRTVSEVTSIEASRDLSTRGAIFTYPCGSPWWREAGSNSVILQEQPKNREQKVTRRNVGGGENFSFPSFLDVGDLLQ